MLRVLAATAAISVLAVTGVAWADDTDVAPAPSVEAPATTTTEAPAEEAPVEEAPVEAPAEVTVVEEPVAPYSGE